MYYHFQITLETKNKQIVKGGAFGGADSGSPSQSFINKRNM